MTLESYTSKQIYINTHIYIYTKHIYIYMYIVSFKACMGRPPRNREIISCRACVRAEPMLGGNASQTSSGCLSLFLFCATAFPSSLVGYVNQWVPLSSSESQWVQWAGPNGPGTMGRAQWGGHKGPGPNVSSPCMGHGIRPMGRAPCARHNGPGTTGRDHGPSPWARSLAKGSTMTLHGPWPMAHGPWARHGPWAHGPWPMDPWAVPGSNCQIWSKYLKNKCLDMKYNLFSQILFVFVKYVKFIKKTRVFA